jgi:hypothetical protein
MNVRELRDSLWCTSCMKLPFLSFENLLLELLLLLHDGNIWLYMALHRHRAAAQGIKAAAAAAASPQLDCRLLQRYCPSPKAHPKASRS